MKELYTLESNEVNAIFGFGVEVKTRSEAIDMIENNISYIEDKEMKDLIEGAVNKLMLMDDETFERQVSELRENF